MMRMVFRKLLNLIRPHNVHRDIERELSFHLEERIDEFVVSGVSPDEARRKALRQFGNYGLQKERIRDMDIYGWLETIAKDAHYSLRRLCRMPVFTFVAVITIGLGIGAATAIFSVVNGVLIKPLPYPEPERLIGIWHSGVFQAIKIDSMNLSVPMYASYKQDNRTFQEFGIWSNWTANVTGIGDPEQIRTLSVTSEILPALGVPPAIGRWFTEADDSPETPETVILTYGYWQRQFGGDESVIGRAITIDSQSRQVIGVMPQKFQFLNLAPDVILPQRFDPSRLPPNYVLNYFGIARLKPGVTLAEASADVARLLPIWARRNGGDAESFLSSSKLAPALRPLKQDVVGDVGKLLWVLLGTVGLVQLIACANVANLLLVRASGRRHELAIRSAIGAGWGRIARELLMESIILALWGGAIGLALAYGGLRLLTYMRPANLPRLSEISIDPLVLEFALATSLVSSVLVGIIPIMKYAGRQMTNVMWGAGRTATHGHERHRSLNTLVVVQVALALTLLVGAGLMIRTFEALRNVRPGFTRPEQIQTVRISIPDALAEPERVIRMQNDILDKIGEIPGVTSAAFATSMPMEEFQTSTQISVEGKNAEGQSLPIRRSKFVSPGFFKTQGTPLAAGREFTWSDIYERRQIAIISENMAREVWGGASAALGKRIRVGTGGPRTEIVGVAADVYDDGVHRKAPTMVYWRAGLETGGMSAPPILRSIAFAIRSERAASESFLNAIRQAVWSVNSNLPLAQVRTLDDLYKGSMSRTSFTLVMLVIAGSIALALGIVGIYGVISYSVSERKRDLGIRLALGASPRLLRSQFVRHGVVLTSVGIVVGLAAAFPLARLTSSLLFGITPLDAATYVAVSILLALAAALASYIPARRACSVDPVEVLKLE